MVPVQEALNVAIPPVPPAGGRGSTSLGAGSAGPLVTIAGLKDTIQVGGVGCWGVGSVGGKQRATVGGRWAVHG